MQIHSHQEDQLLDCRLLIKQLLFYYILKLTLVCPENIQLLPKVDFVALFHIENVKNSIEYLLKIPIYKRLHDFTYIFKDDFGILYGVEIMKIGKEEFIAPEDKVEYQLSIEDILKSHNKK